MEGYRLIDDKTAAKLRMTPQEETAVVEMWAIQNRIGLPGGPMASQIPPGLVLPPTEVKAFLGEIRAGSSRRFRPARSLGADVRLAFIGACVLVIAAIGVNAMFNRRQRFPTPIYSSTPGPSLSTSWDGELLRTAYSGELSNEYLIRRSMRPQRLLFANESFMFERMDGHSRLRQSRIDSWIQNVVGGPLAKQTTVASQPITEERARAAIAAHASKTPTADASRLLSWQKIRVAYAGKLSEVEIPYARFSDKALIDAVAIEQKRIIQSMAETIRHLGVQILDEPATPTPRAF